MIPKLIIFDVDGLLLDTEARWQQAWEEVGNTYHISNLGGQTFLKCVGLSGKEVEDIVYEELSEVENSLEILEEARVYGLQLLEERIDPKPGVYEVLQRIKELPIKVAIATSTSRVLTMQRLEKLELLEYFDYILCGDEVQKRKPNPEIYLKVLDHFQMEAKDTWVLEDSIVGVEAAYRAKTKCIMVPDLIPAGDVQREQTYAIVPSLLDILPLL